MNTTFHSDYASQQERLAEKPALCLEKAAEQFACRFIKEFARVLKPSMDSEKLSELIRLHFLKGKNAAFVKHFFQSLKRSRALQEVCC